MSRRREAEAEKKTKRPRKRVVLVLVEGRSERELLEYFISSLYERIDESLLVYFPLIEKDHESVGGDITSQIFVKPKNIEEKIYKSFMKNLFDREKLYPKDVCEVIQIVDMDGVYINDDQIQVDPAAEKYYYDTDRLLVGSKEQVKQAAERNQRKRENLDYLLSLDEIKLQTKRVKYSVYYFSSNLDHFFHGDANLDGRKTELARAIGSCYMLDDGGVERFVEFVCSDPNAAQGKTLEESWEWIRERGSNSLHAGTNINILFERLMQQVQDADV